MPLNKGMLEYGSCKCYIPSKISETFQNTKDKGLFSPSWRYFLIFQGFKTQNDLFYYPRGGFLPFQGNESSFSRMEDSNIPNYPYKISGVSLVQGSSPVVQPTAQADKYQALIILPVETGP